ncbi:uncharacterized protein LOC101448964 [Ceratitis capitata]|uniref:uncharacterized protein LOC101448964 n=1 Tax=Ceratitis capitata TaxID=7213 RepID=UPI000329BD35|nr:uncharacterized protein LOC101448964 [Ceratitis capitata]
MRLLILFSLTFTLVCANPLPIVTPKLLHKIKERMFGINTDCTHCGVTYNGVHTVQQVPVMPPVQQVYMETSHNPSLQMHGASVASSNTHAYAGQGAQAGRFSHMFNTDGLSSQQIQTVPANMNYHQQVVNTAEASSATNTHSYSSSANLWQNEAHNNAAISGHQQHVSLTQGGHPAVFGPPPVAVANNFGGGVQYNSYAPSAYAGEVFDNSAASAAAAASSSSASSWSQQNGNYGLNHGNGGGAFAHSSSSSWSSSHSG